MPATGGYSAGSIFLQVVPSFRGFEAEARRVAKGMEGVLADGIDDGAKKGSERAREHMKDALTDPSIKNTAKKAGRDSGDEYGGAFQKAVRTRIDSALKSIGHDGSAQIANIRRELETLKDKKIGIDVDPRHALAKLQEVENRARLLAAVNPNIDVVVNANKAAAELAALHKDIVRLNGQEINIDVDVNDKATNKLNRLNRVMGLTGGRTDNTANAFRAFNGILFTTATIGPALVPILAAIAGGMLALGPAAAAAVAGIGVLGIAFSGLGDAIGALNDQQKNAAKDSHAAAKTMRQAAESVADAQRNLARARRDGAEAARDSSKRVKQAEDDLADAQRDATKAQQDLMDARRAAQRDLDDIADKRKQNLLDERQAVLDLFTATTEEIAARKDPGATNFEKEQAKINLENARLRLKNIRDEKKELAAQQKAGIEGDAGVQRAKENVTSAVERQNDAQAALAEAQLQAARTQRDSAEAVADAQRNLARAQKDYADALYETNVLGSASAQKLAQAMDALGPAGQRFARFIFGLKDEFEAIRDVVQAGLFPGLQDAIQTLITTYGPGFTEFAGTIAKVFGDIARQTAEMLTGDVWKQFFAVFKNVSPKLIQNYATVFLNLSTVMAQLMTIAAPFAISFSKGLVNLSAEAVKFMSSAKGQKMWTDFFEQAERLGPPVLEFFEALFPALFKIAGALMPLGELILGILTNFLLWIDSLDPKTLHAIVFTIVALVVAFQATAAAIALIAALLTPLGGVVGAVAFAIVALIGALTYLYITNETARKIIDASMRALLAVLRFVFEYFKQSIENSIWLFTQLAHGIAWLWENVLQPTFAWIARVVSDLWKTYFGPVFGAIWGLVSQVFKDIKWAWENILWPVFKVMAKIVWELYKLGFKVAFDNIKAAFQALWDAFSFIWKYTGKPVFDLIARALGVDMTGKNTGQGLVGVFQKAIGFIKGYWETLKTILKPPVRFTIETILNNGLIKGFNFLAGKLGMDKIDHIPIPDGFHDGGVYGVRPGYTPGRDTHMIAVGGGEAILRPELTRALGADWVYAANARAKKGGVLGAQRFLGGFADGGVAWPVNGARLGAYFGQRGRLWSSGYHTGQDFVAPTGRPIHSVMAGKVTSTGWSSWGGNLTKILVPGLGQFYYAHQSGQVVRVGDQVSAGQTIGYVGNTGNTTGPHLHLELRVGGRPVDPMPVFQGQTGILRAEDKPEEKSRLSKILGALGDAAGWVRDAVANPFNWLKGKIEGPINQLKQRFGDNWMTQALAKVPGKFLDVLVDKIKGIAGFGGDSNIPSGQIQNMIKDMAASKYGWTGAQWEALAWIIAKESSWNPNAQNPTSTAYGLFQFLDGTWGPYGPKTSDPRLQAEYGLKYIKDRYGDPVDAKMFHIAHGWYSDGGVVPGGPDGGVADNGTMMYDSGGFLPPGRTEVINLTGKPEPVFTADQFDRMRGGLGGGFNYSPTFVGTDLTAEDVAADIMFAAARVRRGGVYAAGRPTT